MDIKKIKADILILAFAVSVLASSFFLFLMYNIETKATIPAAAEGIPAVLGETVSIRGEVKEQKILPQFEKLKEPDFKNISATSWLIYDFQTDQELSGQNETEQMPIASLTKLITGLVAYDNLDFTSKLTVSPKDLMDTAPFLGLEKNDEVKINDLFDAMIIGSANDAALALANHTETATGRKFTDLMNQKAMALGMTNSHFGNPLGFDYGQNYSTAYDLKLAVQASRKLALFTSLGRRLTKVFFGSLGKKYKINSTNKLIKTHPELEAVKTGYTINSKGSLIVKADFKSRELIYIILGSDNREKDFESLQKGIEQSFYLPTQ